MTRAFMRSLLPSENVVLAQDVDHHFSRHYGDIIIRFENVQTFVSTLGFSHQMV
jgi:hypothetical protein